MSSEPGFKEEQEVTLLKGEDNDTCSPVVSDEGDSLESLSIAQPSPPVVADLRQDLSTNIQEEVDQTVFDDRDPPRLTPKQMFLNIRKLILEADSVLSFVALLLCVLLISVAVTYFKTTANARTNHDPAPAPLCLPIELISAVTGEPEMSYAFLITSTNGQGMRGRERSIDLAAKYITDHHLQHVRTPVADSLSDILKTESSDYAAKDKMIALLKEVIPDQPRLHQALAWQHVRNCNLAAAINEQKKTLELIPAANQYEHATAESLLVNLLLANGKWNEVINFEASDDGYFSYFSGGRELEYRKVEALFHSDKLQAALQRLSTIKPQNETYEEGLWHGRILLQENKLAEARKYAASLIEGDSPRKETGQLLMTEVLIAESILASNTETRQQLLDKAKALLNERDSRHDETIEIDLRQMQLHVLSGDYAKALSVPGLDRFQKEDENALRHRALFYANRAQCNFYLKSPAIAMQDVNRALGINPSLAKALEVGILVCSTTNDTATLSDFKKRLSQIKNYPRLQTEI